jgi:hypothetical protein
MMKLHKTLSASLIAVAILSVAAFDAEAQRGRGGSRGPGSGSSALELLRRDEVQGEISLTEDQEKALTEMQSGLRDSPEFR